MQKQHMIKTFYFIRILLSVFTRFFLSADRIKFVRGPSFGDHGPILQGSVTCIQINKIGLCVTLWVQMFRTWAPLLVTDLLLSLG